MENSGRARWLGRAVVVGMLYLALGQASIALAGGYRPRMLVALVAWPLLAALPAFLVALAVAAARGVKRRWAKGAATGPARPGARPRHSSWRARDTAAGRATCTLAASVRPA